jgi:5-methylcytosine-specific restriction endonuclease McrA
MNSRLPTVEAIQLAAECNAYIQREARTVAAKKRSANSKIAMALYRKRHPIRWKEYRKACDDKRNQRRREAREGVPLQQLRYADEVAKSILTAQSFVCTYCGKSVPIGPTRTVDHITPKSEGGKHVASNLAPACRSCNSRKNASLRYPHPLTPPIPIAGP